MSTGDEREVPGDDPGNDATPLPGQAREVDGENTGSVARSGEGARTPPMDAEFVQTVRDHVQPLLLDDANDDEYLERAKDWVRRRGGTVMVHAFKLFRDGITPSHNLVVREGTEPTPTEWSFALRALASSYTPLSPCVVPPESLKASKHHVTEVRCLGVDLDVANPAKDCPDTWQHQLDGRAAIVRVIEEHAKRHGRPTRCVDSGGGFQLVYDLTEPVSLPPARLDPSGFMLREDGFTTADPDRCAPNPDRERAVAEVEARNRGLFEQFRSVVADLGVAHLVKLDATQNIDRIFRVPWTPNRPCARKRERGRRPTMARLVYEDPATRYAIEVFPVAADNKPGRGSRAKVTVDAAPGARRVDLETLPAAVPSRCKVVIVHGKDVDQPLDGDDQSRSAWLFYAVCSLVRAGVDDETIYAIITDRDNMVSESVLDKGTVAQVRRYATRQIAKAREKVVNEGAPQPSGTAGIVVLKAAHPKRVAELFREMKYPHLLRTNGDYLDHAGSHYVEVEDDTVKRELWEFLDHAKVQKNDKQKPFPLLRKNVGEVYEPFQLLVHEPRTTDQHHQRWLRGAAGRPPASEVLALPNGLLHVPTRRLMPHTPEFFTRNLIDIPYDPDARVSRWSSFLCEL
ncbi:MAG: hypothetical protein IPK26_10920 [Planctomycetes bacterium]|nr:hypothetical protein [Planctomycetota bacterium]